MSKPRNVHFVGKVGHRPECGLVCHAAISLQLDSYGPTFVIIEIVLKLPRLSTQRAAGPRRANRPEALLFFPALLRVCIPFFCLVCTKPEYLLDRIIFLTWLFPKAACLNTVQSSTTKLRRDSSILHLPFGLPTLPMLPSPLPMLLNQHLLSMTLLLSETPLRRAVPGPQRL